jgi:hypothetical protein
MALPLGGIRRSFQPFRPSALLLLTTILAGSFAIAPPARSATAIDYNVAQSIIITVDIYAQLMAEALFHRKEAVRTGDFEPYLRNWLIPMVPNDSIAVSVPAERAKLENDRRLFLQAGRNAYDLEVTELSFPDGVAPGSGRRVRIVIANTGFETAPLFRVKLFRAPAAGGMGEQAGFTRVERMLEPGPITGTQPATKLPSSVPVAFWQPSTRVVEFMTTLEPGEARYRGVVELVAESSNMGDEDEYDNFKEIQVSVPYPIWTPPPVPPLNDLEVTDVAFPFGLSEGEGRVRVAIRSNGPSSAGTPRVRLFGGAPGGSLPLIEERAFIGAPAGGLVAGAAVPGVGQTQEFTVRFSGEMEFRAEVVLDPMGDASLQDPVAENNVMTVRAIAQSPSSDSSAMLTGTTAPYTGTGAYTTGMTGVPADLAVLGVAFPNGAYSGRYSTVSVRLRNNSSSSIYAGYLTKVFYRAKGASAWMPFTPTGGTATAMPSGTSGPIEAWSSRDVGVMGLIETPGDYEFRAEVAIDPIAGLPPDPNPANNSFETARGFVPAPPPVTDMEVVSVAGEPDEGGYRVIAVLRNNGPLLCSEATLQIDLLDGAGFVVKSLAIPAHNLPSGWTTERAGVLADLSGLDGAALRPRARVIALSPIDTHPENDVSN